MRPPRGRLRPPTGWLRPPRGWLRLPRGWLKPPRGWFKPAGGWLKPPRGFKGVHVDVHMDVCTDIQIPPVFYRTSSLLGPKPKYLGVPKNYYLSSVQHHHCLNHLTHDRNAHSHFPFAIFNKETAIIYLKIVYRIDLHRLQMIVYSLCNCIEVIDSDVLLVIFPTVNCQYHLP